jgi:predicted PurR-regulated permease PerM
VVDVERQGEETDEVEPPWKEFWPPISYWLRAATVVIGVVIAVRVLATLQSVLLIVIAALVIALGLQPALEWMEAKGLRRGMAMGLIVLGGLLLMMGAALAIVPTIVSQAVNALERLPGIVAGLEQSSPLLANVFDQFSLVEGGDQNGVLDFAGGLAVGVFNTITLLLLTPYFAIAFPTMKSSAFRLLRRQHREDFVYVVNQATELTSNYIIGNLTISLVAGVVTFAGLSLIGVPYAVALSAWVAVTDLVPAFGALVGAVPVLVVAALTGPQEFALSLLLIVAYQQFENYILAPRVMKRAVDLSPPVVIVALMIGGTLAGIVGALLALPVAALVKILVSEYLVRNRIETVRAENANETSPPRRRFRGPLGSRPLP